MADYNEEFQEVTTYNLDWNVYIYVEMIWRKTVWHVAKIMILWEFLIYRRVIHQQTNEL